MRSEEANVNNTTPVAVNIARVDMGPSNIQVIVVLFGVGVETI